MGLGGSTNLNGFGASKGVELAKQAEALSEVSKTSPKWEWVKQIAEKIFSVLCAAFSWGNETSKVVCSAKGSAITGIPVPPGTVPHGIVVPQRSPLSTERQENQMLARLTRGWYDPTELQNDLKKTKELEAADKEKSAETLQQEATQRQEERIKQVNGGNPFAAFLDAHVGVDPDRPIVVTDVLLDALKDQFSCEIPQELSTLAKEGKSCSMSDFVQKMGSHNVTRFSPKKGKELPAGAADFLKNYNTVVTTRVMASRFSKIRA